MELAFLLRGAGSEVCWITNQKPAEADQVTYALESKMLDRGVQVYIFYVLTMLCYSCIFKPVSQF